MLPTITGSKTQDDSGFYATPSPFAEMIIF